MLFRALLCFLVACTAFGAKQELTFDGETVIIPEFPGLEVVDPRNDWYKERVDILADTHQFYMILHGHEDDFCVQFFVTRTKARKAGAVTTPKDFKKSHPYEKGVKHLTDRLWLYQTSNPKVLGADVLCSGKLVSCLLSRFRNENETNKEILDTTEEDERRLLAWCQALIAANPALTRQQQKDADNDDRLDLLFSFIIGATILYTLFLKLQETRAKAQMPWTSREPNKF